MTQNAFDRYVRHVATVQGRLTYGHDCNGVRVEIRVTYDAVGLVWSDGRSLWLRHQLFAVRVRERPHSGADSSFWDAVGFPALLAFEAEGGFSFSEDLDLELLLP